MQGLKNKSKTNRMSPKTFARLFTESGGWGLPTIDADGLAAIALLRFCDIPFAITPGASQTMTSAEQLPVVIFEHDDTSEPSACAGLGSLIALLTADLKMPDPNAHLTPCMIAESTAFATLTAVRFGYARLYEFYINEKNYSDIYHTLLSKDSSFPLNRVLPFLKRRHIKKLLQEKTPQSLIFDAGVALTALSTRLGERNKFFYGDQPSVLDAIVFGYLATVLYVPLPCTELRGQVAKFGNLVAFVERVRQRYFESSGNRLMGELDGEAIIEERRRNAERQSRQMEDTTEDDNTNQRNGTSSGGNDEDSERKKWNNYFIWGSVAVLALHVLLGNEVEFEFE